MTYHSLTPRQQRVWDAAYGAAYVQIFARLRNAPGEPEPATSHLATELANLAANSIQPNDDGQTTPD